MAYIDICIYHIYLYIQAVRPSLVHIKVPWMGPNPGGWYLWSQVVSTYRYITFIYRYITFVYTYITFLYRYITFVYTYITLVYTYITFIYAYIIFIYTYITFIIRFIYTYITFVCIHRRGDFHRCTYKEPWMGPTSACCYKGVTSIDWCLHTYTSYLSVCTSHLSIDTSHLSIYIHHICLQIFGLMTTYIYVIFICIYRRSHYRRCT